FAQPIVSRAKPEMLKSHFIPTMEKLKKRAGKVVAEEEHLRMEGKSEVDSENGTIRDEFAVLCRDLYALYPLLIRYVDNNRHRATNMFLNAYKRNWLETEGYSFEDKMIDDLSSCHIGEEDEGGELEGEEPSFEVRQTEMVWGDQGRGDRGEKEMEKQRLLYQQSRLHNRGAAEMVLQMISACKGEPGAMVSSTLKLGISILNGGNSDVQQKMLDYLKDKKDVGFFLSVQALMQTCSFCVKATIMESISDFYWYYSGKDIIDEPGKRNFSKAMTVAKQVFNSLTEYIQGPCTGNQQSLAHSRLWDAVVGFLHVFAHMMMKLAQDSSQIGLLKELLDLQKDMVVMLLSLLEGKLSLSAGFLSVLAIVCVLIFSHTLLLLGNVVNGTIARQMVDMLVESSSNVEMILKFFDMFLKLKDIVASDAFRDYVTDPRGLISKKDFSKAMDSQKQYSPSEIQFLLSCSEADENEMINFEEFADRFQEPAKDIGFNIAVLLTNLSEHVPHDTRLQNFLEQAESVLNYFRPFLGRIEIMGASRRIERIYFEISEANRNQWEMPQVRESKRQFIFDVVNEGCESEKMEMFVNFCEDTIFEMNIAASISEPEGDGVEEEDDEEEKEGGGEEAEAGEGEEGNGEGAVPESASAFAEFLKSVMDFFNMFTFRNLRRQYRKLRRMTVKEMVVGLVTFVYTILMGILIFVYNICKGFFTLIWKVLFGGGLVEGAKKMTVTEILASMPDPTQDEVHGDLPLEPGAREVQEADMGTDHLDTVGGEEEEEDGEEGEGGRLPGFNTPGGLGDFGDTTPEEPPTPEGTPLLKRKLVPLVIFKREKELARKLEFDGLYVTEQPEDDDIKGQWDRLVLNTP
ncbi:hypothetical protein GOODEAATRI_008688, partial [Goodea atripinnis]